LPRAVYASAFADLRYEISLSERWRIETATQTMTVSAAALGCGGL